MNEPYLSVFGRAPKPSHKFATAWCDFLTFQLKQRRLNQSTFADLVGEKSQVINQYVNGRSKPPLNHLERWADALKLDKGDRWRFHWLALEAYTPRAVWDRIIEMESTLAALEQQGVDLALKLDKLAGKTLRPGDKAVES